MATGEEEIAIFPHVELSEDILFTEILLKLPVKSLMRFKCVSKRWLARISSDSHFIDAHLNQQPGNRQAIVLGEYQRNRGSDIQKRMMMFSDRGYKQTEIDVSNVDAENLGIDIVGSCNGLICLTSRHGFSSKLPVSILLWNPATHQMRKLPDTLHEFSTICCFGFGFDRASRDYKVVKLIENLSEESRLMSAQVFAKSGDSWRDGGEHGVAEFATMPFSKWSVVEASGALHWLMYNSYGMASTVVHFDLSDEVLRMSDAPDRGVCICMNLSSWRDSLVAFTCGTKCVMWVATFVGGDCRWAKHYEIDWLKGELLRGVWGDECLVVTVKNIKRGKLELWRSDPNVDSGKTGMRLKLPAFCVKMSDPRDYVESIVSVHQ